MQEQSSSMAAPRRALVAFLSALLVACAAGSAAAAATPGTPDSSFGSGGLAGGRGKRPVVRRGCAGRWENCCSRARPARRWWSSGSRPPARPTARSAVVGWFTDRPSRVRSARDRRDGRWRSSRMARSWSPARRRRSDGSGSDGILVERFNSGGSLDSSFGSRGVATALGAQLGDGYAVAIQSDGKIIASGSADATGPTASHRVSPWCASTPTAPWIGLRLSRNRRDRPRRLLGGEGRPLSSRTGRS